jgi:hypothetical protein
LLHTFLIVSLPPLVQHVITKHTVFQHIVITNYSYSSFKTTFGNYVHLPIRDVLSMTKTVVDFLLLWYGSSLQNLSKFGCGTAVRCLRLSVDFFPYVLIGVGTVRYITALRNAVSLGTAMLCLSMCNKCIVCPIVSLLLSDLGVIQCRDVPQSVKDC